MMSEPKYLSGFVTIIGSPNVGKSTLMNRFVGQKVSIVSQRAQTTRNRIMGVVSRKGYQMVFLDTPGVTLPKNKLGEYMVRTAESTLQEVDVVLFVVDATEKRGAGEDYILNLLQKVKTPVILVVNKIDKLADKQKLFQIMEGYNKLYKFAAIVPVSALNDSEFPGLVQEITKHLPEGPAYFPEDMITDQPERVIAAEMIREKVLRLTRDEIPHSVAVEVDEFKERDEENVYIRATIFVERESQKGIVIGAKGSLLKKIGQQARADIEKLLYCKVFLDLWVKVKADWRNKDKALKQLGYKE